MRFKSAIFGALALFCLALLTGSEGQAQTTLGVRGGVSISHASLDIDDAFARDNRTGFVGGVFLDFRGSSLLGFQVGAQYAQQGTDLDFGDAVEELSLAYLEIPAVVKVGLPLGFIKPSAFGGVAMGFNTGCDEFVVDSADICDEFSSLNWAGVFGADVMISLGSFSVWADTRYHVGLNDVAGDLAFIQDLKNRSWQIQGGIGFPLGG